MTHTTNMVHSTNVGLMLAHLAQRLLFARLQRVHYKSHLIALVSITNTPYYVSPLYTEVGTYCFTPVRSVCHSVNLSPIHFSPALSIVQAVKHETLTQCWANVGPSSTMLSQHQPCIGLPCRVWRNVECGPASQRAAQH